jgi:3-methyl-2-oxobutanoate hydroxymethyltransferase
MERNHPTVFDIRANRGRRQMSMLWTDRLDEARAADAAGIDILSIIDPAWSPAMRDAAGRCFVQVGLLYGPLATTDEYLRAAHGAMLIGADCCYCAAAPVTIERLAAEGIPVVGHVGLIPTKRTWTGGWKAVGKTLESAKLVYDQVKTLENAGAFAAEIEVVPEAIATAMAKRTSLLLFSMGAGRGCDAQYLFSCDVLGYNEEHVPRHARQYRNFRDEYARLQAERRDAFSEFKADVESGQYPEDRHLVAVDPDVEAAFAAFLDSR